MGMDKKKNNYSVIGMLIGTGIGGGIAVTIYAITGNPVFIAFTGIGTALGLIFGAGIDKKYVNKL